MSVYSIFCTTICVSSFLVLTFSQAAKPIHMLFEKAPWWMVVRLVKSLDYVFNSHSSWQPNLSRFDDIRRGNLVSKPLQSRQIWRYGSMIYSGSMAFTEMVETIREYFPWQGTWRVSLDKIYPTGNTNGSESSIHTGSVPETSLSQQTQLELTTQYFSLITQYFPSPVTIISTILRTRLYLTFSYGASALPLSY